MEVVDMPGMDGIRAPKSQRHMQRLIRARAADSLLNTNMVLLLVSLTERNLEAAVRPVLDAIPDGLPLIVAISHADRGDMDSVHEQQEDVASFLPEQYPEPTAVSVHHMPSVEDLLDRCFEHLPVGPFQHEASSKTPMSPDQIASELLREEWMDLLTGEAPYAISCEPSGCEVMANGILEIRVTVWVENDRYRRIVIGGGGHTLRDSGTRVRAKLEKLVGRKVFLSTTVEVNRNWEERHHTLWQGLPD